MAGHATRSFALLPPSPAPARYAFPRRSSASPVALTTFELPAGEAAEDSSFSRQQCAGCPSAACSRPQCASQPPSCRRRDVFGCFQAADAQSLPSRNACSAGSAAPTVLLRHVRVSKRAVRTAAMPLPFTRLRCAPPASVGPRKRPGIFYAAGCAAIGQRSRRAAQRLPDFQRCADAFSAAMLRSHVYCRSQIFHCMLCRERILMLAFRCGRLFTVSGWPSPFSVRFSSIPQRYFP